MPLLVGCGLFMLEQPGEIPVGGPRATVVVQDPAHARENATFGLREPAWVPDGFTLSNVGYVSDGEISSVDLAYAGPNDRYVHIWQTNIPDLGAEDPLSGGGAEVSIGDQIWLALALEHLGPGIEQLTTRFPRGVTMTIDGNIGREGLERVAASLGFRGDQ